MKCPHTHTRIILTPHLAHYGKIVCDLCEAFLGWAKKPETIAREARNAATLVRLRDDERLTAWERKFVSDLEQKGPKFSPDQQACLEKIAAKYV